jgi:hypothetical protein
MTWVTDVWPQRRAMVGTGDIVVFQYTPGDPNSFHTVLVTDPKGAVSISHTEMDGMEISYLEAKAKDMAWVFKPRDTDLGATAARYATFWSQPAVSGMRHGAPPAGYRYSHARAYAVGHEKKDPQSTLPFEFEALRRAIKWSLRDSAETRFSNHKGTTCCTFVTASFQAAVFSRIPVERRKTALAYMNSVRNEKAAWRKDDKTGGGKVLVEGEARFWAYKSVSNVGAKVPNALEEAVALLGGDPANANAFLIGLLGTALMVDAKYLYSSRLIDRLKADGDRWKPMHWEQYKGP